MKTRRQISQIIKFVCYYRTTTKINKLLLKQVVVVRVTLSNFHGTNKLKRLTTLYLFMSLKII